MVNHLNWELYFFDDAENFSEEGGQVFHCSSYSEWMKIIIL